jgi:putative flippase GtrA
MLLPFFQWCESLWLGQFVVNSNWLFPVIEAVHLLALSVLGGAVLVVDLRLLGLGLKVQSPSELWRAARPWMIGALATMIATGVLLFLSEPIKLYYSDSFWVKITTLPIAIAFAFTIRSRTTQDAVRNTARRQMLVGALSIALWVVVAAAGRWIGFS